MSHERRPMRRCALLLPGDLDTPTGGYRYDRRLVEGLRGRGWQVDVLSLAGTFPMPDAKARAQAEAAVAALPDDTPVIADGLAFGALPDTALRHAHRLRWLALVHHPLGLETGLAPAEAEALLAGERRALAAARRIVVTSAATARLLERLALAPQPAVVIEPGCDMPAGPLRAAAAHEASSAQPPPHQPELRPAQRPELRPEQRPTHGLAQGTAQGPAQAPAPSPAHPSPQLLCVASVTPRKGHRVLLEALAPLAHLPWTLHCVGSLTLDPATAAAARAAALALGLQHRVHWHGATEAEALPAHYARADLFVLPSLFEGYGMVLAEALAHGLPVVATDTGAAAQLLAGGAGVRVPPGDAAALRAALAPLLCEPARRAALRQAALAAHSRLPIWPAAWQQWERVLASVDGSA